MELSIVEEKARKRKDIINLIFSIGLILAVFALIVVIVVIIRYEHMLSNPLGYNLAKFNISQCTCFSNGQMFTVNATQ